MSATHITVRNMRCYDSKAASAVDQQLIQRTVQQHALYFIKSLPKHVDEWKTELQECNAPVHALVNKAEQLRHVEKAYLPHMENFRATQDCLQYYILRGIEEEIATIKSSITKMTKLNHNLRNKLSVLENSTSNIDWDDTSELILGTALQPPLSILLSKGLDFYMFFNNTLNNINKHINQLDVRNEKYMCKLKEAFDVDFSEATVRYLLAITQYV